jgi:long-subunit fatty acid transport protein
MVGIAGAYYEGTLEFTHASGFTGEDQGGSDVRWDFTTVGEERMEGWGGHVGILIRPGPKAQFGAVLRSPVVMTIESDSWASEQQDLGPVVDLPLVLTIRELRLPLSFAAGAAVRRDHWLFVADVGFTDWSQAEYTNALELSRRNLDLRRSYDAEYTVGGGVEWRIPASTTTLRAGARWSGLPYADSLVVDDRFTLAAGIGLEIDRAVHLDLAAAWDRHRGGNPIFGFDERYARVRGMVTVSYQL